jgi:transporter family-2 protein
MGTSLVFVIAWLVPQVGAGPLMISLLAGQIFGGMLLSHFGWLGSPVKQVTLVNLMGALVMMGGVVMATYSADK